jgi:hypothetical protein
MLFWPALAGLAAICATSLPRRAMIGCTLLFLITNVGHLICDADHANYTVRDAGAALARSLPVGSVLAGQLAPELAIAGGFESLPVEPGLANDKNPVETCGVTDVLVTRVPYWQNWWRQRYPQIVRPSQKIATVLVGADLPVDVYRTPAGGSGVR